jgi:hypothetical protein
MERSEMHHRAKRTAEVSAFSLLIIPHSNCVKAASRDPSVQQPRRTARIPVYALRRMRIVSAPSAKRKTKPVVRRIKLASVLFTSRAGQVE